MRLEIALSVVILLFACAMIYLSYGMSRQFGWNIYKKIGADVQMQRRCDAFLRHKVNKAHDVYIYH